MAEVNFYCPQCGGALQADAGGAGMQVQCPQCGNVVAVPQWAAGPGASPAGSQRPTAVTVFGILGIVFGGLGLACTPVGLIATFAAPTTLHASSGYMAWLVVSSLIGLAAAGWLLAVGIGLLGLKRWARSGAVAYGWFALIFGVLNTIVSVALLVSGAVSPPAEAMAGYIGGTCGGLLGLIFPILLLVFMTRPHVIEACNR
jgi:predicted RNA-binding Zn-ribbon protein involved in translation (DUF1610 family)